MRFVNDSKTRDLTSSHGLRIIACGLPRCATSSLQHALELSLGLTPCMHMAYCAPHAPILQLIHSALLEHDKGARQLILHRIFDGYAATADFPGMMFVDDLLEMYPEAKLVLNTRGPEGGGKWVESGKETLVFFHSALHRWATWLIPSNYWQYRVHLATVALWQRRHGLDEFWCVESYVAHNKWVRDLGKRYEKEVLEWKAGDGWGPLVEIVGGEVPREGFPHLNDRAFIKKLQTFLLVRGILAWVLLLACPVMGWFVVRWLMR